MTQQVTFSSNKDAEKKAALMRRHLASFEQPVKRNDDIASEWVNLRDEQSMPQRSAEPHPNRTSLESLDQHESSELRREYSDFQEGKIRHKYRKVQDAIFLERHPKGGLTIMMIIATILIFSAFMIDGLYDNAATPIGANGKLQSNVNDQEDLRDCKAMHPMDQLMKLQHTNREVIRFSEVWSKHEECAIYCAHVTGTEYRMTDVETFATEWIASGRKEKPKVSKKGEFWRSLLQALSYEGPKEDHYDKRYLPEDCTCSK